MSDGMVVISKEELAALIAAQFVADVRTTYGASANVFAARVVDALPTSEPVPGLWVYMGAGRVEPSEPLYRKPGDAP